MKNIFTTVLAFFCVCSAAHGMNEADFRTAYSCTTKLISFDETTPKEHEVIHHMFHNVFGGKYDLSDFESKDKTIPFLKDIKNRQTLLALRNQIEVKCHNLCHRKEVPLVHDLPFGIVRAFIRTKSSLCVASSSFSEGQGLVVGKNTLLTAEHMVRNPYVGIEDLNDVLDKTDGVLPDDYEAGKEWEIVYVFYLPTVAGDFECQIHGIYSVDDKSRGGPVDILLASSKIDFPCKPAILSGTLPTSDLSAFYLERNGCYKMYKVSDLSIEDNLKYPEIAKFGLGAQLFFGSKFMKPGNSGAGMLLCSTTSSSSTLAPLSSDSQLVIHGVFNGKLDIKRGNSYIPLFRFSPIAPYKTILAPYMTDDF